VERGGKGRGRENDRERKRERGATGRVRRGEKDDFETTLSLFLGPNKVS
jgi:hypothetical protein